MDTRVKAPAADPAEEIAAEIMAAARADDGEAVRALLGRHAARCQDEFYREVGHLTRRLHEALTTSPVGQRLEELAQAEIPDARVRLDYVVTRTEESANRTLDAVERALPVTRELSEGAQALSVRLERLRRREPDPGEFARLVADADTFLARVQAGASELHSGFNEVLMAQDFQDLTGQVVGRVIAVVQEVEEHLVKLVRLHGRPAGEAAPGPACPAGPDTGAEGPAVAADGRYCDGQDDVDDLLSSLGF